MRHTFFRPIIAILLLLGSYHNLVAQQISLLEKRVSIEAQGEPLEGFLNRLSKEVGGVFSYSPSTLDVNRNITGNFSDQSCREVLEEVFDGAVNYKQKGVYLILTPAPPAEKEITISGYVVDEQSGDRIKNATVYNPITLQSSTTDEFGFFQFQVKNPAEENFQLIVNKKIMLTHYW
ncbi:hypothetical protein V8V91_18960 [Algoriphagus halophilus]|uniref:hypothetical protein n=1 Tax=Algoriphagus halophilus TaxID=226505 RepID=UPI00358E59F7